MGIQLCIPKALLGIQLYLSRAEYGFNCESQQERMGIQLYPAAAGQGYNLICQQDIIEIQPYIPVGLSRGTSVYLSRAE